MTDTQALALFVLAAAWLALWAFRPARPAEVHHFHYHEQYQGTLDICDDDAGLDDEEEGEEWKRA